MTSRDFEGKVAVVTGASRGLGRACATLLAKRGARVVLNGKRKDLKELAIIADEIKKSGSTAIINTNHTHKGDKIIQDAIDAFGGIHILINAASPVAQPKAFTDLTDDEWCAGTESLIKGNYMTAHAAWQHFSKQGYGRIINISSDIALYGSADRVLESTVRHSQIGYSFTLAREGIKKNILVNVLVESETAQSGTTPATNEEATLVAYLVHDSNKETGQVFQAQSQKIAKLLWQRSDGLLLRGDETLTPGVFLKQWSQVENFDKADYPSGPRDFLELVKRGQNLPSNQLLDPIAFLGRAVLITGAGSGLGRAYALHFASLGASVMVNDIADPQSVVDEIRKLGGTAAGIKASAEEGEKNVEATIEAFGRIDVVVNNAGILRDKSFQKMSEPMWDQVLAVHLAGTYKNTRAAWPHFVRQGYGRVINTTSVTGVYGQFGQANYAAAKSSIIGFTRALACEGAPHDILANVIAPNAGTNMTKTILSDEVSKLFQPAHVAPVVSALASHTTPRHITGGVYETGSGWLGKTRWEITQAPFKASGVDATTDEIASMVKSLEASSSKLYPSTVDEHRALFQQRPSGLKGNAPGLVLDNIKRAQSSAPLATSYTYEQRDLILYALSVGAKHTELPLVYEGAKDFTPLPVFGLIPFFNAKAHYKMGDIMTKYDQRLLLHVDQFLEIRSPIPVSGTLTTYPKLVQVVDKGKDVLVIQGFTSVDERNHEIFYNETTVLVRGGGGFGGDTKLRDRGAATTSNTPPSRSPDHAVEEKTTEGQAALYRLNGDLNPLHIDPEFSAKGGFKIPILHGLCSLSIAGKHIFQIFGSYKNLKARFTSPVLPGQTLRTEMWREKDKVLFQVVVLETGKKAISGAAVTLDGRPKGRL